MAEFIGTKAAILIGGRLLVTLRDDRPDIPCPNMWDLPGGGREGEETPEACMIRETREEVGLDLAGVPIIWKRRFASAHHEGEMTWFFVLRLPATAENQIRFGDEGQGWRLITPEDYRTLPDAVPYLRDRFFLWQDGQTALSRPE